MSEEVRNLLSIKGDIRDEFIKLAQDAVEQRKDGEVRTGRERPAQAI